MDCQFSDPVNYLGAPASEGEFWNFQTLNCDSEQRFELIQNPTTGGEFYLDKTMSYGDLILIIFVSIFLIFGIFKFVWNFIQQNWNYKI